MVKHGAPRRQIVKVITGHAKDSFYCNLGAQVSQEEFQKENDKTRFMF